ncbi:hypothetical protein MD484_g4183, partial [Candolleomyces efflorescens]
MFSFTPEELSALELAVEHAAALYEESYRSNGIYRRCFNLGDYDPSYPDLTVKYSECTPALEAENIALHHLFNLSREDGSTAPHVPQPVHYFKGSSWDRYIVMERIKFREVSDDELYAKAAEAVLWLRGKRPPPSTRFGCIGGVHYARHLVFEEHEAPTKFNTVFAAEQYFNMVLKHVRRRGVPVEDISLVNDDVVLTQSCMAAANFGVDLDGRAVLFDASTIQALPVTLADFSLLRTTLFGKAVSRRVFGDEEMAVRLRSPSMNALAEEKEEEEEEDGEEEEEEEEGEERGRPSTTNPTAAVPCRPASAPSEFHIT